MGEAKRKVNIAAQVKIEPIQELVNKICSARFDSSHVAHLLILLRSNFNAYDPILLDVSNFVAHAEGRSQGISFKCIQRFIEQFIAASKRGGTIVGPHPVFKRTEIVQRLVKILRKLSLIFDEEIFFAQGELIIDNILHLMKETEFQFSHAEVVKCYLKRTGAEMMLCLHLDLQGPLVKMSPDATVQFKIFG